MIAVKQRSKSPSANNYL